MPKAAPRLGPRHPLRRQLRRAAVVAALIATLAALTPGAASASSDRRAPTRPGPLSVQSVGQTSAVVQFGRSRDRSRRISYSVVANGRVVARSLRVTNVRVPLRCGYKYFITAVAYDRARNRSRPSPGANLRTRACLDTTIPDQPTVVRATASSSDTVTITWRAAQDPQHGVVGSYLVYRDGAVLGGSTGLSFTSHNLRPDTRYRFSVRARDRAGNLSRAAMVDLTTPPPPQATGNVHAFLLTSDDNSFADARLHYMQLGRVYPTFFDFNAGGGLTGTGDSRLTSWFEQRGIEVMPRFHTEDAAVIESIVADPTFRGQAIDAVERAVISGGYDGANLDLEMNMPTTGIDGLTVAQRWDRLRDGYSSFVEQLSARLHQAGKQVTVSVSPNWCSRVNSLTRATEFCTDSASTSTRRPRAYLFDYKRLGAAADELWVMAWGWHWASSDPGPMADARWLRSVTDYFGDLFAGQPRPTLTLGTDLYGMDWSYRVVRTDQMTMPGGTLASAPACSLTSTARPRYSFSGSATAGTLTVEWVCLTRYAATSEYDGVVAQRSDFVSERFDESSAENVLTGTDPTIPDAIREIWFTDAASIAARADIAAAARWGLGFWRLGKEDQSIWSLPSVTNERTLP